MRVRLYRARNAKGYVDEFSLYFPYPKRMVEEYKKQHDRLIKGTFLGCSQASDGSVIRCIWCDLDVTIGYSIDGLGRRWPLEKMSKEFRAFARKMERLWNNALKYNDDKHWDAWNLA